MCQNFHGGSTKLPSPEGPIGSLFGIIHVIACYSPFFLGDNWMTPHYSIILGAHVGRCSIQIITRTLLTWRNILKMGVGIMKHIFFHSEITLTFVAPTGLPVFVRNMDKIQSVPSLHHWIALIYMYVYIYI